MLVTYRRFSFFVCFLLFSVVLWRVVPNSSSEALCCGRTGAFCPFHRRRPEKCRSPDVITAGRPGKRFRPSHPARGREDSLSTTKAALLTTRSSAGEFQKEFTRHFDLCARFLTCVKANLSWLAQWCHSLPARMHSCRADVGRASAERRFCCF